jgi:hypothetical protein
MKSLLVTILLLVFPFLAGPHELLAKTASADSLACSISHWQPDSIVSVYFIRGRFTTEQRQALIHAMGSSEETARKMGISVTFSYAGETDGLIDCEGCLTVARHEGYPTDRKARTSFNALRRNERGQLTSAWIGIEQGSNNSSGLRALKFETERGVRGTKILSVCRG